MISTQDSHRTKVVVYANHMTVGLRPTNYNICYPLAYVPETANVPGDSVRDREVSPPEGAVINFEFEHLISGTKASIRGLPIPRNAYIRLKTIYGTDGYPPCMILFSHHGASTLPVQNPQILLFNNFPHVDVVPLKLPFTGWFPVRQPEVEYAANDIWLFYSSVSTIHAIRIDSNTGMVGDVLESIFYKTSYSRDCYIPTLLPSGFFRNI